MKTLEHSPQIDLFEMESDQLMSSAVDSPVKTSALQDECQEQREKRAGFGVRLSASSPIYGHGLSSLKIRQSFALADWCKCSASSARSGMMRSGTVSLLTPLTRLTGGIASGLYPTPLASETGFRRSKFAQGGTSLSTVLGGIPNPAWVEWLMQFPPSHTDLPPLATPSSRKSRK